MSKLNQKGFSAIEGLLSLIAVVLIIFVGYYVYHSQQKASDTLNEANNSAESAAPFQSQTFKFANLGVQFKLTKDLAGLKYSTDATQDSGASAVPGGDLTTSAVTKAVQDCFKAAGQVATDKNADYDFGNIFKGNGTYIQDNGALLKQFDGYYIAANSSDDVVCPTDNQAAFNTASTAKRNAYVSLMNDFKSTGEAIK